MLSRTLKCRFTAHLSWRPSLTCGGTPEQRDPRHLCCTQVLPLSCVVRLRASHSAQVGPRPAELQPSALAHGISNGKCAKHKCKLDGRGSLQCCRHTLPLREALPLQAAEHGVPRLTVPPQRAASYHQHDSRGRCMLRMQLKAVLTPPDARRKHARPLSSQQQNGRATRSPRTRRDTVPLCQLPVPAVGVPTVSGAAAAVHGQCCAALLPPMLQFQ